MHDAKRVNDSRRNQRLTYQHRWHTQRCDSSASLAHCTPCTRHACTDIDAATLCSIVEKTSSVPRIAYEQFVIVCMVRRTAVWKLSAAALCGDCSLLLLELVLLGE